MRDNIKLDGLDLLYELEIANVRSIGQGEIEFSCPFTEGHAFGDFHPSSHMNKDTGLWRCKTCKAAGNAFDFVRRVKDIPPMEAMRFLRERYGTAYREPEGGTLEVERRAVEERWAANPVDAVAVPQLCIPEAEWVDPRGAFYIDWRDQFTKLGSPAIDPAAEYMLADRGFSPATLEDWQIGYDSWTDRITIPIRDEDGALVGFKGRGWRPDAHPKYLLLGDSPDRKLRHGIGYGFGIYEPSDHVFGLYRAKQSGTRRLVMVEGELNTIALHSYGVTDAVALGMSFFSDKQLRLIRWYAEKLITFLDSDPAGQGATWGYIDDKDREHPGLVERLIDHMDVWAVDDHEGDPAEIGREKALDLLAGARSWKDRLAAVS